MAAAAAACLPQRPFKKGICCFDFPCQWLCVRVGVSKTWWPKARARRSWRWHSLSCTSSMCGAHRPPGISLTWHLRLPLTFPLSGKQVEKRDDMCARTCVCSARYVTPCNGACVCMCAWVGACACACACVCVRACVYVCPCDVRVSVSVSVSMLLPVFVPVCRMCVRVC